MKIIILKNNLKEGIESLGRLGAEGTSTLPILRNFLLKTEDGKIRLSATNLELAITKFIPGKIVENGGITVPLGIINSLVSNLQSERVQLDEEETSLFLKTDNYQAKIQGIKEEDFPIIPKIANPQASMEIGAGAFAETLSFVSNAAQMSAPKPELRSVLFDFQNGLLRVVATDSFRLAEKVIHGSEFSMKKFVPCRILVPLRTVYEVLRVFKDDNSKITIEFDESQILFRDETTEIISRLLGGEFPDYEAIIPKESSIETIISRADFIQALKLTGSFTDRLHEVKLSIKENAKALEVASVNQALGENRYLIPAKIKGDSLDVVFNWRFLLDGLKDLNAQNIILKLVSDSRPAVIIGAEDNSYLYLLMPIKAG